MLGGGVLTEKTGARIPVRRKARKDGIRDEPLTPQGSHLQAAAGAWGGRPKLTGLPGHVETPRMSMHLLDGREGRGRCENSSSGACMAGRPQRNTSSSGLRDRQGAGGSQDAGRRPDDGAPWVPHSLRGLSQLHDEP